MTYLCVPLRGKRGGVAYVSERAWAVIDGAHWYKSKGGYAFSPKLGLMHRRLMAAEYGEHVDHKNFCRLDNRDENLSCGTQQANNRRCRKRQTPWPYKGVRKIGNSWNARITVNRIAIHIGSFPTAEEAALAYDTAARKFFGHQAVCNFGEI